MNKEFRFHIVLLFCAFCFLINAQIKIGDNPNQLNNKALLELESSDKGLKLPITPDIKTINNFTEEEKGMVMYDDLTSKVYYWNSTQWVPFTGGKFFTGDSSLDQAVYVYEAKHEDTKVGIGTNDPQHILHIDGDGNVSTKEDNVVFTNKGVLVIGGDGSDVSSGALIDIKSTNRGLLLPSINPKNFSGDIAQEAMILYDNVSKNVKYYNGTIWLNIAGKFKKGADNFGENENYAVFVGKDPDQTRLGIGTDSPEETVHVEGGLKAEGLILSEKSAKGKILLSDADGKGEWSNIPEVAFLHNEQSGTGIDENKNNYFYSYIKRKSNGVSLRRTLDENMFVIQDDGKVAIGTYYEKSDSTNSLKEQLEVGGNVMIDGETIANKLIIKGEAGEGKILTSIDDKGTAGWRGFPLVIDKTKGIIYTKYRSNGVTPRNNPEHTLVVKDNGFVGLGIENPQKRLHVKNNVRVEGIFTTQELIIEDQAGADKILTSDDKGNASWSVPSLSPFVIDVPKQITYIEKYSDGITLRKNEARFIINDAGNMGIGTDELYEKLNVKGNVRAYGLITNRFKMVPQSNKTISYQDMVLTSDAVGNTSWKLPPMVVNRLSKEVYIANESDGITERTDVKGNSFKVLDDGRVGIGTTPTKYKLVINGPTLDHRTIAIAGIPVVTLGLETVPSLALGNGLRKMDRSQSSDNLAIGIDALKSLTDGQQNTAMGYKALNILIGDNIQRTLGLEWGKQNTALGVEVLPDNTKGTLNTVIGYKTGAGLVGGVGNTIIGSNIGGLSPDINKNVIIANGEGEIYFHSDEKNRVIVGNEAKRDPVENVAFEVASSTGGFMMPRVTTAERQLIAIGDGTSKDGELIGIMLFDTDLKKMLTWNGVVWVEPGKSPGMRMLFNDVGNNAIPLGWKKVEVTRAGSIQNEVLGSFLISSDPSIKDLNSDKFFGRWHEDNKSNFYIGDDSHAITPEEMPIHKHTLTGVVKHKHKINSHITGIFSNNNSQVIAYQSISQENGGGKSRNTLDILSMDKHNHEHLKSNESYGRTQYSDKEMPNDQTWYPADPHSHGIQLGMPSYHVSGVLIEYVGFK